MGKDINHSNKLDNKQTINVMDENLTEDVFGESINLDAKVTIKNLAGWDVGFVRLQDGVGDVKIVANGQQRLSRNEIAAQINNGNKLFVGTDGLGSHATLYITDAETRKWVGFEDKKRKQMVFTDSIAKDLFKMNQNDFETNLPKYIKTRAEKYAFIEAIKNLKLNDYSKIVFASKYTGFNIG